MRRRIRNIAFALAAASLLACLVVDDVWVFDNPPYYGVCVSSRFDVTSFVWYSGSTNSIEWTVSRRETDDFGFFKVLVYVSVGGRMEASVGKTVPW